MLASQWKNLSAIHTDFAVLSFRYFSLFFRRNILHASINAKKGQEQVYCNKKKFLDLLLTEPSI